jgi:hypothetical protein
MGESHNFWTHDLRENEWPDSHSSLLYLEKKPPVPISGGGWAGSRIGFLQVGEKPVKHILRLWGRMITG